MKEPLFKEFPEVSAKQWRQQIETDLKGADFDEQLIFRSLEGIAIQPFYTSKDLDKTAKLPPPQPWCICEKIEVEDAGLANQKAKEVLEKGAESLWFVIPSEDIEPKVLFENIDLSNVPVHLKLNFLSEAYVNKLSEVFKGAEALIFLQTDIIGNLAQTGNWFFTQKRDFQILKSIEEAPGFRSVVSVDAGLYQNAGANIPQQLGYALAHLEEYLQLPLQKGQKNKQFLPQFLIATGGNYFFEIAKIRALRSLYSSLAEKYGMPETCMILAQPSLRDKTLYDNNVNLLRTTTQSMSAILGGADAVYNTPYDMLFRKNSEFGERIARNQLLIMKHEAYLNKVANPADGAYYIESLTSQFINAAKAVLDEIRKEGGFIKLLFNGKIRESIEFSAAKEQELFDKGELILIGTNKYPNPQDMIQKDLEFDPFKNSVSGETLVQPIIPKRLSQKMEQERLHKELNAS